MRPTSTTKPFEERVVGKFLRQKFKRYLHVYYYGECSINQEVGSGKSITPKIKRHNDMSK
jgi:hypothetical protein